MAKKKKSLLPGLEIMIIVVFFISFILFAVPRCNEKRLEYASTNAADAPASNLGEDESSSVSTVDPTPDSILVPATIVPAVPVQATTTPDLQTTSISTPTTGVENGTSLFVTIDGLNIRRGPSLDSAILNKLVLFEEVFFLNEITPFTEEISLGTTIANEPWVKVKTVRGGEGWVYGAGVYYYKRKYPGMEE